MRLNEFSSPLNKYLVTVKVHGTSVKTLIHAESQSQARLLLGKQYGEKNVVSVSHIHLDEQVIAQPIASQIKHERLVRWLTNRLTLSNNRPSFTQDDVRKAVERFKTRQKRANLELEKQQALNQIRDK